MHWNSRTGKPCCSPHCTKANTRRCCNFRHSRRRRLRQKLKRALPLSAERRLATCLTKSRRCALSAPQVVRRIFIADDDLDGCAADQKYLPALAQRKPKRERPLSQV